MATQKQIEANRKNAQKSTGPTSDTGKAVSRLNALQSGIDAKLAVIAGEDKNALKDLSDSFYRDHQPATAMERAILDGVIRDTWLLQRFFRIESDLLEYEMESDFHPDRYQHKLGKAFRDSSQHQIRLQRRIDSTRKSQLNGIKEFERLQAERLAHPPAEPLPVTALPVTASPVTASPVTASPVTPSPANPNPQIGFVPDNAPEAPQPDPILAPPAPESRPRIGFIS